MLARMQSRLGQFDEATKLLRSAAQKLAPTDSRASSTLLLALGDLFIEKDRYVEAAEVFEKCLDVRGIRAGVPIADEDREYTIYVLEKLIHAYKLAEKPREVRAVIERARGIFEKDDPFADRQLISYHRSIGEKAEALATVRTVRLKRPGDNSFLRLEATLLAESGNADAAVALVRQSMNRASQPPTVPSLPRIPGSETSPAYDEFSNLLFIANLYSNASRGKDAADAANQAYAIAVGLERKQIAKLTLATAQQMAGDFGGAETTLRDILKQTPGNPIALNNLGYFLIERDERLEEAFGLIQQALKIDPRNPSYLDSIGWASFKLGKLAEAERYLKHAARIDSDSAAIQEHLGDVYAKMQNRESAKQAWEKALRLSSDPVGVGRLKSKLKK
jgi:Flp pilus assembly protein TadD